MGSPRVPTGPGCSQPATWSTPCIARRSRRQVRAAWPRWTPSGTCATRPGSPPPRACPWGISPRPNGRPPRAPEHAASGRRLEGSLELEQPALALDTPAVPAERSPAAQDAVAGDDDRDRVGAQRVARRARAARAAGGARHLRVAQNPAVGDLRGHAQHAARERSDESPVERQVEPVPAPAEVLL